MKIRSFTVSLLASVMLSASLISCAIPPASPTITPPATQTPTLISPSQTPAPTETPSPESLLPQEVKEKFELAGVDLAQMENAKYDKDGLHITLADGGVIVLTNTDLQKGIYIGQDNILQYRGVFHDSVIYTFDKATGKWVGISEAESAAIALFDKYNIDPATYTLAEVDGIMVGTDNETGTEIFRDGRFEISYAVELAKKDCEPTNFEPDNTKYEQIKNKDSSSLEYLNALLKDSPLFPSLTGRVQDVLIDRTKKCWGFTNGYVFAYRANRAYRDEVGLGRISLGIKIPIIPLLKDGQGRYIINR